MKNLKIQLDSDLSIYGMNCVQIIKPNFFKRLFGIKTIKFKRIDPTTIRITKQKFKDSKHYISDVLK